MKQINHFLRGEASVLLLLALALLAQTPHPATVFFRLSDIPANAPVIQIGAAWVHAGFYAIALEFATLLFVVRGNRFLSWLFAGVSVAANVAYYWHGGMDTADMARAALISLALPACIAFYSHNVAHAAEGDTPPAPDEPPAKSAKPKRTRPAPASQPATPEAEIEALLEGVQMDGTPTMEEYWRAAFASGGTKAQADEATGQRFGTSARTVARRRTPEWEVAG